MIDSSSSCSIMLIVCKCERNEDSLGGGHGGMDNGSTFRLAKHFNLIIAGKPFILAIEREQSSLLNSVVNLSFNIGERDNPE